MKLLETIFRFPYVIGNSKLTFVAFEAIFNKIPIIISMHGIK